MTLQDRPSAKTSWPIGGGALGALIRDRDWAATPLGAAEGWSPALKGVLDLVLPARAQIVLFWGEDYRAFYNDAYAPTIGHKHPAALGEPAAVHWGELWDDLGPLLEGVRATGETFSAQNRPFRIDRQGFVEEVFFDVSYSPVREADGRIGGVLCIVNETTALVQALDHLDLAQASGAAGVFEWYPDSNELAVSDGYRRLMGMAPGSPVSTRDMLDRMHPDDLKLAAPNQREHTETFSTYIEYRVGRADTGEERWLSRRGGVVRPRGGRARMVGVVVDITERKRAEQALMELNATLEARVAEETKARDRIWRNSRDLMSVMDSGGVFRQVNPAWTALLGYRPDEVVGRRFLDFVLPEERAAAETALAQLETAHGATPSDFEGRLWTRSGDARWISWRTSTEDGLIYAYGRDVTEERAATEALARAEEQLRQSQKMEAVGQLTGGLAHDFNNLLQGVTGSLDLMRKRIGEGRIGELDRFINGALSSAERASALTHRLLAFARRQPLDPRPLKPNPLVAGMEDLLRRTLGEGVELELVLAGGLWLTLCDANQLENALLNLAINARDAMPGGGKLTIETANTHLDNAYVARDREVKPGQYVCLSVSDTGTGMAPEVMTRAFDPFFTTKPLGQGTGLGLSMIYGFARQSEGSIKLYSEPGRGTTAKIYLPRYRGPLPDQPVPEEAEGGFADETVLVVEDDTVVRALVVEILGELGYRSIEAADGLEGLRILKSDRRIDLLVTDIGLPGLDGRQMTESARAHRPDLRVLFMTGYAENAALASGFLEPGMQMITKPFAMDTLARRIAETLRKP